MNYSQDDILKMDEKKFKQILLSQMDERIVSVQLKAIKPAWVKKRLTEEELSKKYTQEVEYEVVTNISGLDELSSNNSYSRTINILNDIIEEVKSVGPEKFVGISIDKYSNSAKVTSKKTKKVEVNAVKYFCDKWQRQRSRYDEAMQNFRNVQESMKSLNEEISLTFK